MRLDDYILLSFLDEYLLSSRFKYLTKFKSHLQPMSIKELKVNYKKLLKKADKANGRKETVSYLNRAAKLNNRIYSKTKTNCIKCNGSGFLRISLDESRTCLSCYGKGFLMKEIQKFKL